MFVLFCCCGYGFVVVVVVVVHSDTMAQFSSVQDGISALGKAHMRATPSLRSFPNVASETVPVFVRLTMALSRRFKEDCLALPLSMSLSYRRSMV